MVSASYASFTDDEFTALQSAYASLQESHHALQQRVAELQRQVAWFQNQLFGRKSEQRYADGDTQQLSLGVAASNSLTPTPETREVRYLRSRGKQPLAGAVNETGLRFDATVPVKEIRVLPPEVKDLEDGEYTVIGENVSHRLAQRPGAYVVLKYVHPVIKLKDQRLVSAPATVQVLEKCYADVSLLAGMLTDKFVYHLPLYRIHQRLKAAGIELARPTLTTWVHRAIALLEPVYDAQFTGILESAQLAMDETPIKAARKAPGQMQTGYFWPVYGERDEVVFPFAPNRGAHNVPALLRGFKGRLLTDGYVAYDKYAAQVTTVTHAHCWAHLRRMFLKAEDAEPERTQRALEYIRLLYYHETELKEHALTDEKRLRHRTEHSKPVVDALFDWLEEQMTDRSLLPKDPFTQAVAYALQRKASLSVFLAHPEVPLDTNHLERALRVIPMGRKSWLFCWTEVGAQYVGIIQSLLVTCKLQGVDPYDYLVDVLQRISGHPASRAHELTPRLWKQHFADNPLRSPLYHTP